MKKKCPYLPRQTPHEKEDEIPSKNCWIEFHPTRNEISWRLLDKLTLNDAKYVPANARNHCMNFFPHYMKKNNTSSVPK